MRVIRRRGNRPAYRLIVWTIAIELVDVHVICVILPAHGPWRAVLRSHGCHPEHLSCVYKEIH